MASLAGLVAAALFLLGVRGFRMMRAEPDLAVDSEVNVHLAGRRRPMGALLDGLGRRLGPSMLRLLGPARQAKIRVRLEAAGRPEGLTVEEFAARKAALTFLGFVGALFLAALGSVVYAPFIVLIAFITPDISLSRRGRLRADTIERDLPDFLDVLAVTVGAGLGFRQALGRVADALGGPVAQEMHVALRQMDLGMSRRVAFEQLRARNSAPTLGEMVTALLQSEELGAPLADTLQSLAIDMRKEAAQGARRRAARAAPRVSLVVTTLMVPGAMLLIGAGLFLGSGVNFHQLLGGGG